jgi:hypothetical protein
MTEWNTDNVPSSGKCDANKKNYGFCAVFSISFLVPLSFFIFIAHIKYTQHIYIKTTEQHIDLYLSHPRSGNDMQSFSLTTTLHF